jgi:TonB family protein
MKTLYRAAALVLFLAAVGHAQTKETYCPNAPTGSASKNPTPFPPEHPEAAPKGVRAFTPHEVTTKAILIDRPEPIYTEQATQNGTRGTVRLRLVFCPNGSIETVKIISRLPDGLTEKALEAAHKIKFKPAIKDGVKVAQFVTIDYNFEPF